MRTKNSDIKLRKKKHGGLKDYVASLTGKKWSPSLIVFPIPAHCFNQFQLDDLYIIISILYSIVQ